MTSGIRPSRSVARLTPYVGSPQTALDVEDTDEVAKLDWNECVRPPSPRVRDAILAYVEQGTLNWYPDVNAGPLCAQIARYAGLDLECVRVFSGADAALEYVVRAFADRDEEVLWCPPTYDNFRVYVESCGTRLKDVRCPSIWEPSPGSILAGATAQTRLIYLVNPNNPTGTLYAPSQIEALLESLPHVGFVVDEAYAEFSGVTVAPLVASHPNLIVIRSFAKAFGLAGLRVGYTLSHPDNGAVLDRIRVGKNVNSIAQVAACAALEDREYLRATVAGVRLGMRVLADGLGALAVPVRTTIANFALVRVAQSDTVCRFLKTRGIYVRNRDLVAGLEGHIRITVGDPSVMERVVRAFADMPTNLLFNQTPVIQALRIVRRPETECEHGCESPRHDRFRLEDKHVGEPVA